MIRYAVRIQPTGARKQSHLASYLASHPGAELHDVQDGRHSEHGGAFNPDGNDAAYDGQLTSPAAYAQGYDGELTRAAEYASADGMCVAKGGENMAFVVDF